MPEIKKPRTGIFTDLEQAQQHVGGRYVLWNKRMYLCKQPNISLDGDLYTDLAELNRGDRKRKFLDDEGFNDFKFDPLGWTNTAYGTMLTELKPIRQTRRGYGQENTGLYEFQNEGSPMLGRPAEVGINAVFADEGFTEMLRDEYPDAAEALNVMLAQTDAALAISRSLCIQSDADGYTWLWRYADRVGLISTPVDIRLGKRWTFLKEELEEGGVLPKGVWVR